MKSRSRVSILVSLACMIAAVTVVRAADRTWTGLGGDARWANAQNWADNTAPAGSADQAIFPAGTPTACTVDASTSIKCIYFRNPGMTLTVASGVNLALDNLGALTMLAEQDATIDGDGTLTFSVNTGENFADNQAAAGKTLTILAKITGANGFEHNGGGGTIVLANAGNDQSGATLITAAGAVSVPAVADSGVACPLGSGSAFRFTTVGTAFRYTGAGGSTDRTFNQNAGAGQDVTVEHAGSGTLTFSGPFLSGNNNSHAFVFAVAAGATIENSGLISNGGTGALWLYKQGAGTQILSAAHAYTGNTAVDQGVLGITASGSLSAGSVIQMRGGTLQLNAGTPAATYTASFGALQVNGADSSVSVATGATSAEVTFAALAYVSGNIDFTADGLGTTTKIFLTGQPDGLIGPWATVNGRTEFAAYSSSVGVYSADLPVQTLSALGPSTITNNADSVASITEVGDDGGITLADDPTAIALLSQEVGTAAAVTLGGKTLVASSVAIASGAAGLTLGDTVGDGTLTAASNVLILANANAAGGAALTVNAAVANNGGVGLIVVKSGPGDVTLAGALGHTGGTALGAGALTVDTPASTVRDFPAGVISGNGALKLAGAGTLAFPNVANTYAGTTTVAAGTARILNSAVFGSTAAPTVIEDGGAVDFWGTGNQSLNLNAEALFAEGLGPDGQGALRNTGSYSQYDAIRLLTLTDDLGIYATARLDVRNKSGAATIDLNGHGIEKRGSNQFGLTGVSVINDQNTAFIDILQGSVTFEVGTTLSGGASNVVQVRNGAYFDYYDVYSPINWSLTMDGGARVYTRAGNATNRNVWAGPVTLGGSATFESGGALSDTYTGVISGTGPLVKTGSDHGITCLRNTNNAWTAGTTVSSAILYAPVPEVLPGYDTSVTVNGTGCLAVRVSDAGATQPGWALSVIESLIDGGTVSSAMGSIGFETAYEDLDYTSALPDIGIRKFGPNTLTLTGSGANLGPIRVYGGTLDVSPASRYVDDQNIVVGINSSIPGTLAALVVTNAAELTTLDRGYNVGGQPQVIVGDSARGVMLVSDSAKVAARVVVGNAAGSAGAVYQTGGTVHNTGGAGNDGRIGGAGYGYYLLAGGTYTNNGYSQVGQALSSLGILEQTGGNFNYSGVYGGSYGLSRGGTGVVHVSGGQFRSSVTLWVGDSNESSSSGGYAALTVTDDADVTVQGAVDLGNRNNMTAMLNLKGGVVNANRVWRANRTNTDALLNWNGGLFRVNGTTDTELFNGGVAGLYPEVTVYEGGAHVDLPASGMARVVNTPLRRPTALGVAAIPVATPGAGYLGSPFVKITGGGGKGAAAYAHIDPLSGTLTAIEIVSPGTGYTSSPTVALSGGGATTAATLGVPMLGAPEDGGLTKLGAGTLVLNAMNTYIGPTEVQAGTLRLGHAAALTPFTDVTVSGGTLDLGGNVITNESVTVTGGQIVNGTLATAAFVKDGPGTVELSTPVSAATVSTARPLPPGLWEGRLAGAFNTTDPNPETEIQLTTRAANGACGENQYISGAYWPINSTYVYSGYIWNRAETNETWTFAENFDDSVLLLIDGNTVLNNGGWSTPTMANVTLAPGAHAFELRLGQGGGGAGGNVSGWWTDASRSFAVDFLGRNEANLANYVLLSDSGDGALLTAEYEEAPAASETVVTVSEGTLRLVAPQVGLYEGMIPVRWDTTTANPATAVELTTTAANGWCNSGGTINGKLWPDNSTYVYSGYIWNRTGTNETWTFAENFDDQVLLRIDGATVLDNAGWNTPTRANITLSPGSHVFDLRLGQGGGGAAGNVAGWWTSNTRSFAVDFMGRNADVYANYELLTDPGDGSRLTLTSADPLASEGPLADAGVHLAAGAVLDLNGEPHKVALITGDGVVSNGTLSAGTVLSPAGDVAVGTLALADVALGAGTTYRLTVSGASCDTLTSSGTLDLSGVTVVPATGAELTESSYIIAHADGGFAGVKPAISGFPPKYKVIRSGTDMVLTSQSGTVMLFR